MISIPQKYANNTVNYARQPGGYYSEEYNFVSERNFDVLLNGNNNITHDLKVTYNIGSSLLDRGSRHVASWLLTDCFTITNTTCCMPAR
jgi:hypothetical protein